MSKKHFEDAAAKIREMYRVAADHAHVPSEVAYLLNRADAAEDFALRLFSEFNPRFDGARFRAACRPA